MNGSHGIGAVFTDRDLARLREGKCLDSGAQADPEVVHLLTDGLEQTFLGALWDAYEYVAARDPDAGRDYRRRFRGTVRSRSKFLEVAGELMVRGFLGATLGFTTEPLETLHGGRRADFQVAKDGCTIAVEVKTAVGGMTGPPLNTAIAVSSCESVAYIRRMVKRAVPQLKQGDYNLVAIVNWRRPPLWPDLVFEALFGVVYLALPTSHEGPAAVPEVRRDSSGKLKPRLNRRIGVVGVFGGASVAGAGAYFLHNPYALRPVSPELLDPCPQLIAGPWPDVFKSRNARIGEWHIA